jgi:STAM-binding protein
MWSQHTYPRVQMMMPEAIAIVMAPTDKRSKVGLFRLTTPGGMDVVRQCDVRGFHQHQPPATGQEVYELSGHVYLDESSNVNYKGIDLR